MAISKRVRDGVGSIADIPEVTLGADGKLTAAQVGFLSGGIRAIIRKINGEISFGSGANSAQAGNIDGQSKEYYFDAANTTYEIPHGLGRVPIGIIVLDVNVDGAVVRGDQRGDWNDNRLFLRCSQAGTTALFVIV